MARNNTMGNTFPTTGWEETEPIDAEDSGFGSGIVPAGAYSVEVVKAYWRSSQSSGRAYINLELKVIDDDQFEGRYLFLPLYVHSESENFRKGQKGFLAKVFTVCTGGVPDEFPSTNDDLAELVGCSMDVKVIVEKNKDNNGNEIEQNRVTRATEVGDAFKAVDPEIPERTTKDTKSTTTPVGKPKGRTRSEPEPEPDAKYPLESLTWDSVHALPKDDLEDLITEHEIPDDVLDEAMLADTVCEHLKITPPVKTGGRRGGKK
jgi:hypothetical protein